MIDKYISRLKIVGEYEIAECLQQLKAERDEAFSYLTFLLREREKVDCSVCKHYGNCNYNFGIIETMRNICRGVTENNNQRKNQ